MERSQLPLPSLLGLFGSLLMLSPELLLGTPECLSDFIVTDPGVEKALAFGVEQFNRLRLCNANYFKVLRVLKVQSQVKTRYEYHFTVELVETTCGKRGCCKLGFKRIQMCKQLAGNPKKEICSLKVTYGFLVNFQILSCT